MGAVSGDRDFVSRLVVGLAGPELDPRERAWLARYQPAGVILYRRNVRDADGLARLCAALREVLRPDAEIMADHEGGPVSVLDAACGRPPAPWTLGLLDDPELTREVMADMARRARDLGVDRLLAPCTDVLHEPANPIIAARAFGDEVARVARQTAAAVTGLREGGVRCCLKHWPGHGGTRGDTHLDAVAPVTPDDPAPLLAGLAAGADAVMLGHLRLPEDPRPASVSAAAAERLRREAPGARLMSDDLTMGALAPVLDEAGRVGGATGLRDPGVLPRAWFTAAAAGGCDVWLCRGIPWAAWPLPDDVPGPAIGPDLDPATASYPAPSESWRRVWARAATPVLDPEHGALLFWRPASDHRWGDFGGEDLTRAGWTGEVRDAGALSEREAMACAQALVVAHAPPAPAEIEDWTRRLAPAGDLVLLGHPVLADRFARHLPSGWRVHAGHDLRPEVLAPFIVRGARFP